MSGSFMLEVESLVSLGEIDEAAHYIRDFLVGQMSARSVSSEHISKLRIEASQHLATLARIRRDQRTGSDAVESINRQISQVTSGILGLAKEVENYAQRNTRMHRLDVGGVGFEIGREHDGNFEKVWGRNTLQNIAWLTKGIECSKAVCRVITPTSLGTGFLVRGKFIITNNHVVRDKYEAAKTVVEFNFEEDVSGNLLQTFKYEVDPKPMGFFTNTELDCSVFKIIENSNSPPISSWGQLKLDAASKVEKGQHLSIIQHPGGGPKKISVTSNEVVNLHDYRVQYMTDTLQGSSGSPVFNDKWEVVALHHAGGALSKNSSGDVIYANEGILMNSITNLPTFKEVL